MRKKGEKDNRNGLSAQGEIERGKTREVHEEAKESGKVNVEENERKE